MTKETILPQSVDIMETGKLNCKIEQSEQKTTAKVTETSALENNKEIWFFFRKEMGENRRYFYSEKLSTHFIHKLTFLQEGHIYTHRVYMRWHDG